MAGTFTLTINMPTYDGKHSENADLVWLLNKVAQEVGSGKASAAVIDRSGTNRGSYSYGAGMLNAGR